MNKKFTAAAGCPVVDSQNVMTAGPRGPQLLQDVWFLEKLAHLDREVIPETHRNGHQTPATLGLMVGFALMMVLDTALGLFFFNHGERP